MFAPMRTLLSPPLFIAVRKAPSSFFGANYHIPVWFNFACGANYHIPGWFNYACGANYHIPGWFNYACGANYPYQALKGGLFCICVESTNLNLNTDSDGDHTTVLSGRISL